jgi:hypothetical protein
LNLLYEIKITLNRIAPRTVISIILIGFTGSRFKNGVKLIVINTQKAGIKRADIRLKFIGEIYMKEGLSLYARNRPSFYYIEIIS